MVAEPEFREDPVADAAATWLARRERGLTPAEQDGYLQWLREAPEHAHAIARLEQAWAALDVLGAHHGLHGTQPADPDLLAPVRRPAGRRRGTMVFLTLALAATVVLLVALRPRSGPQAAPAVAANPPAQPTAPEWQRLPDGSVVALHGGKVEPVFTPAERRIRLVAGEAHFAVAKNAQRPFIVDTGEVTVRAVGTAFDVVREQGAVAVIVTEGTVEVRRVDKDATVSARQPAAVTAGQRARVLTRVPNAAPVVQPLVPGEADRALAWRDVKLDFTDAPLAAVVAKFNARNARQIEFGDAEAPRLLLGGSFRSDNVDGFVRLLEESLGVRAERRDDGNVVLRVAK